MTGLRARHRATIFRRVGWLAVAAMTVAALLGPATGAVLANSDINVTLPFGPPYSGIDKSCDGPFAALPEGEMGWHFVQNQVPDGVTSGKLTVTFSPGGTQIVDSSALSGKTLHWNVFTGAGATLTAASTDVTSPGQFNLSHICGGSTTTTTTSTTSTTTTGTTTTGTTTTGTTTTGTTTTGTTTTGTGGVEAATATPKITPPPTATTSGTGTPGGDGWRIALLAIAALLTTILLLTPASPAKARRR